MPGDPAELNLARVESPGALEDLVHDVFSDPQVRRGMGWTEADDTDEALEAIWGLWERRFREGWRLFEVRHQDERAGLAGLGPVEEATAWWAVYLTERGRGLGQAIGRRLAKRAREEGAEELVAVTWARNQASQGMLEALGFESVGPAPYDWARESELEWLEYRREAG